MIKKFLCAALVMSAGFFLYSQVLDLNELNPQAIDNLYRSFEHNDALEEQKDFHVNYQTLRLNLNPHTSSYLAEAQVLNSTHEGLFSYNSLTADPDYAICQEFKTSRDKLYWIFTLRSDAKFSDGTPITSEDFKKSWLALLSNRDASYASFLDVIKGAREYRLGKGKAEDVAIYAKDKNTLCIELTSPLAHLPQILCHHSFAAVDLEKGNYSGPYKILKHTERELILVKNEYYYNKDSVLLPKIVINANTNAEEVTSLFNKGELQWIDSDYDSKALLDKEAILLEKIFGTTYYFFKEGNSPYLTEKVRQALMAATPWDQIRYGAIFPAGTLVLPLSGYSSPAPLDFTDFDYAKNLMKEAKKELGLKEEDIIELTAIIPEGTGSFQQATMIKNAWARAGVNLKIKVSKDNLFMGNVKATKADLFIYTWIGDFSDPVAFLELFRGDSNLNESNWKNEEYDRLLEKANHTMDKFERYKYLSDAEDILLSSGMIIPVCYSIGMATVNTNEIGGWSDNPLNIHPFKNLYFKKQNSAFKHGVVALK